ncbi:hypothetical protein [Mesorhizobium kowhaii]|uniref:hypothetical protein n=1 Tax=Mesorhizobium kowhaii TaxID=1300272 RepID=UPI00142E12F0|nr:hypothetical protein [Mesorhizobium kowhaii]
MAPATFLAVPLARLCVEQRYDVFVEIERIAGRSSLPFGSYGQTVLAGRYKITGHS